MNPKSAKDDEKKADSEIKTDTKVKSKVAPKPKTESAGNLSLNLLLK